MDEIFYINTELDIPIYRQLADAVRLAIHKNNLTSGQQLPTVQELTQKLDIARGTVKRAYDELERLGLVEKVQGRGTFVSYQPANSGSRKERAMAAIDTALDQLEEMGFSPMEINIFLNLKLRERAEEEARVKVAVVECNPENLTQMAEQLRHLPGVDIYSYLLENVQQYPYMLSDDFDLIVTTASHADYLESIAPQKKRVVRTALRISAGSLAQIIKLRPGRKLGILSHSPRFGMLLYDACQIYTEGVAVSLPFKEDTNGELDRYLTDKDVLLVPGSYEKFFNNTLLAQLHGFPGVLIDCGYEMDEGSLLYLKIKIDRLLSEKKL